MKAKQKPIPKLSEKRRKALGDKPIYSTISKPRKSLLSSNPVRRRKRSASEFKRIYGSKERAFFVTRLPCAACHLEGRSVNAHLLGNGGMSRKADHTTIGPLCADSFDGGMGCHRMYDEYREVFERKYPDFDPQKVADQTEKMWQSFTKGKKNGTV